MLFSTCIYLLNKLLESDLLGQRGCKFVTLLDIAHSQRMFTSWLGFPRKAYLCDSDSSASSIFGRFRKHQNAEGKGSETGKGRQRLKGCIMKPANTVGD